MIGQPRHDVGMFVRGVIVGNGMDDFAGRDGAFHGVEELDEFLVSMLWHAASDDGPVENIEGGKQCRRAITLVIMGHGPPGRAMATTVGISLRAVQRLWDAHRLQPHRLPTFKRSNDPKYAEKVEDVVGLYMDPPAHPVVLSIDEKSQIQALDRTQPGLPLKPVVGQFE